MGNFLKIGNGGRPEEKAEGIIGEIRMFISTSIPSNFLLLDGSSFVAETYPDLYTLLGDSNTLPDFRDRFVRAWGTSRDPNTTQDEEVKSHVHSGPAHTHSGPNHRHLVGYSGMQGGSGSWYNSLQTYPGSNNTATSYAGTDATGSGGTGNTGSYGETETRPKNISVVFAICAK